MVDSLISKTERKNYLYVEGADDRNVFIHLLIYHGIITPDLSKRGRFKERDEFFDIKDCVGFHNLLKTFKVEFKGDIADNRYGIVVDADTDIADNWDQLLRILVDNGYSNLPSAPNDEGTVLKQDGLPIVGIWLMPNNKLLGAIEEFVSFLGPQNDELWPIAESAVLQAISVKCNFHSNYLMKAHLHTWLAWQEEPGTPMGQAITKRYVDADAPHALQVIEWFREVFEI